jgi:hypothetical protein
VLIAVATTMAMLSFGESASLAQSVSRSPRRGGRTTRAQRPLVDTRGRVVRQPATRGNGGPIFASPGPAAPTTTNIGRQVVAGGTFQPGFGVNNGFPAPSQVFGGTFVPGYGVNNGFASPTPVFGGTFLPGFGVLEPGIETVYGGTFVPGFGVMGSAPQQVFGGSFVPGFGVMGGAGQQVAGGTALPGFGVMSSGSAHHGR